MIGPALRAETICRQHHAASISHTLLCTWSPRTTEVHYRAMPAPAAVVHPGIARLAVKPWKDQRGQRGSCEFAE